MRFAIWTLILAACAWAGDPSIDEKVRALLPRPEEEMWLRVRWRRDLLAAREEAERVSKPLFLWVMDGDPLGCT